MKLGYAASVPQTGAANPTGRTAPDYKPPGQEPRTDDSLKLLETNCQRAARHHIGTRGRHTRLGPTNGSVHKNSKQNILWKLENRQRTITSEPLPAATHFSRPAASIRGAPAILKLPSSTAFCFSEPFAPAGHFTHSPPRITRSLTDTSRRSGDTPSSPSLTLHIWPSSAGPGGSLT
jgi:hypothetical protein